MTRRTFTVQVIVSDAELSHFIWQTQKMGVEIKSVTANVDSSAPEESHGRRVTPHGEAPSGRKAWTEREDEILRLAVEAYPTDDAFAKHIGELVVELGRTEAAIKSRRWKKFATREN